MTIRQVASTIPFKDVGLSSQYIDLPWETMVG